jgi:hypothetical protein
MRLPRLLAALAVTAMAFALFGANARAATQTLNPGGSFGYSVTLQAPNSILTDMAAIFCPPSSVDTGSPTVCGHVLFTATAAGTISANVAFSNDNQIDLVLCSATQGIPSTSCPVGELEIPCARTQVIGPTTTTVTVRCAITSAGDFELLVVPNLTSCPDLTDVACGVTFSGTVSLSGSPSGGGSGTGGGTSNATQGKVSGGGKVDDGLSMFSIMAIADATQYDQGHVKYQQRKGCRFRSVTITNVIVRVGPQAKGGSADVDGTGYVNNNSQAEGFHAHVEDGGEGSSGSGDAFSLTTFVSGCNTSNMALASGNTQIHPANL